MKPQPRYQPGDKIGGRYQVHQALMGGMGEVYFCYDHQTGMPYAVKTFQDKYVMDKIARDRFTQEALTWVQLEKHPNIVRAYYVNSVEGKPYIFLEMVVGPEGYGADLRSWLRRGPLDVVTALHFAMQFCLGMEHAQEKVPGLVHRDIKPENILITQDKLLKVTDFGLVRILEVSAGRALPEARDDQDIASERLALTRLGAIMGTPPYMSPEQCRGKPVDVRSDIYSFGCVLYEMLTGKWVFEVRARTQREWINRWIRCHLEGEPTGLRQLIPSLPIEVETVVSRCLQRDARDRYSTFYDLLRQLTDIYKGLTGEPPMLEVGDVALNLWELNTKGAALAKLGAEREALTCFNQVLEANSSNAKAWGNKGAALLALGEVEAALKCLDRAIELAPGFVGGWYNKAKALQAAGHFGEAVEYYDEVLDIDPQLEGAWHGKGICLSELGRLEEAVECYDRALEISPWTAGVWSNRGGCLFNLVRFDDALLSFERALEIDGSLRQAWIGKVSAFIYLRRYSEVFAALKQGFTGFKVEEKGPDSFLAGVWTDRGVQFFNTQQYDMALQCHVHALALRHDLAEAWINAGNAFMGLGRAFQGRDNLSVKVGRCGCKTVVLVNSVSL